MASAKQKPFAEITVSELHRDYLISRTTFYRLFDNTVDVLEYMVDRMGREILLEVHGDSPKELTVNAITALKERRELIELLSASGHLSLFLKKQEEYLPLSALAEGLDLGDGYAYFHGILAQIVPTAMEIWARDGMQDSPEEVYEKLAAASKCWVCGFRNRGLSLFADTKKAGAENPGNISRNFDLRWAHGNRIRRTGKDIQSPL